MQKESTKLYNEEQYFYDQYEQVLNYEYTDYKLIKKI